MFAYLPVTFLYLVPFYLLGDVRLGLVLADLAVASVLYRYAKRWRRAVVLVFLFAPFTVLFSTEYVNAALVAMPFMALFFLFESEDRSRPAAVCFGVALAASQFVLLTLPIFFLYEARKRRLAEPLIGLLVTLVAVIVPLLRFRDLSGLARNSMVFLIFSSFILPNDFFWAYLELPFMLGLFWLSGRLTHAQGEKLPIPKT